MWLGKLNQVYAHTNLSHFHIYSPYVGQPGKTTKSIVQKKKFQGAKSNTTLFGYTCMVKYNRRITINTN